MAKPKEIRLNALEQGNPSFQAFGLWAHPRDRAAEYTKLDYWTKEVPAFGVPSFRALTR